MSRKPITVKNYPSLEQCLMAFMDWDKMPEDINKAYWSGHDGFKPYRKNIGRWLKNPPACWGWAEYSTKSIHVWFSKKVKRDKSSRAELLGMIAHELAHLRKPRPKDKMLEEKKASLVQHDAITAYGIMNDLLFPTQEAR